MGSLKTHQNGNCRDVPAAPAQVLDPVCEVQLDSDMISGVDTGIQGERKVGRDTHEKQGNQPPQAASESRTHRSSSNTDRDFSTDRMVFCHTKSHLPLHSKRERNLCLQLRLSLQTFYNFSLHYPHRILQNSSRGRL